MTVGVLDTGSTDTVQDRQEANTLLGTALLARDLLVAL